MLKGELSKKVHVLEEIDQLIYTLNRIDMKIQTEVDKHINEEGNQKMNLLKKLENDIISLHKMYHSHNPKRTQQTEKEHSYRLTLSY